MTQGAATKSDIQAVQSDLNILEARLRTCIADASNKIIATVIGIMIPIIVASGLLTYFGK